MRTVLLERRPQHSQPRNDSTKMLGLRDKYVIQNINNLSNFEFQKTKPLFIKRIT